MQRQIPSPWPRSGSVTSTQAPLHHRLPSLASVFASTFHAIVGLPQLSMGHCCPSLGGSCNPHSIFPSTQHITCLYIYIFLIHVSLQGPQHTRSPCPVYAEHPGPSLMRGYSTIPVGSTKVNSGCSEGSATGNTSQHSLPQRTH